jgi:UDP-glucose 4-epimerase
VNNEFLPPPEFGRPASGAAMISPRRSCIVLGAGGFLGTNLCRWLVASGARVRAFGRHFQFPGELEGADVFQGDFSDPLTLAAAIEGHEIVFHLIHAATPQSANRDMAGDVQHSVVSTLALLDVSRQLGVKRIVFVSSGGVIYGPAERIPTPETAPTDPITAYGVSKLAIEKYLGVYEHLYGLDYRILRVTNPFGPFQASRKNQGIIAALISRALRDESIEIWGDGSVVRDYIFVADVINALEAATVDQSGSRIFNIGTGQGRSLREVIAAIERQLGQKLRVEWKPARPVDVSTSVVAIERAREVLGWAPKTPFDEGLKETIAWWRGRKRSSAGSVDATRLASSFEDVPRASEGG